MEDLTGQRLNDYHLVRLLGRGAMASVYLADQASLARRVAVKVLKAELGRSDTAVDRFRHEARAAAALVHANIVQVYEVGCADGWHFLAQEYVAGGTLGAAVERGGPIKLDRALAVLWQVGSALAAAAERGVVHRDIKPDNLMVDRSGAVKVADFGLARLVEPDSPRLTQEGLTMGTPLYMSPEQVEGKPLDGRSDLYSLGATVYHLMVGRPPFDGDTPLAVAAKRLNEDAPAIGALRGDIPAEFAAVIDRLMRRAPDERYASPLELLDDLRDVARAAERDGWADAEGVDEAGARGPLSSGTSGAQRLTDRLKAAMNAESNRRAVRRWRPLWAAVAVGFALGAAGAWFAGREPLVPPTQQTVERETNVKAQLYRARLVGTEDAWLAVERYFPDADEFYHLLALRGLATDRLVAGTPGDALAALERLAARKEEYPDLARFGQAALVVAHTRMGDEAEARRVLGALDSDARRRLQDVAPQLAEAFARAIERLNGDRL